VRELESCDKMIMMKMNNLKITVIKTIMKTSQQSIIHMNCFVRLTDPHATGLCGNELLDIGIIGYSLAGQLLGKVVQTN